MAKVNPEALPAPLRAAAEALTALGIQYGVHQNREIAVIGDIDLKGRNLTELPNLSCVTLFGNFFCQDNQLTSLKGAPAIVLGHFVCNNNKLTTLEYAPKTVRNSFLCDHNELTSLEGAPKELGGEFHCGYNLLRSLKGGPKRVEGSYNCHRCLLVTLEGAPEVVGRNFNCPGNPLTHLEGAPQRFRQLHSDHGRFESFADIPDNILYSPDQVRHKATTLERAVTVRRPLKLGR